MATATTASTHRTAVPAAKTHRSSHRGEVKTMMNKLYTVLFRKLAHRESTRFNGQLLDQRRNETFLAMYQAGLIR
ncbi:MULTISPECIES: hypothetical protein [unclassified Arthrobacter]|uniref:hypothetical protein n=1 Tax=unclassified Arthrobacter TaxID=235627 RepID=UPI001E41059A|nr:hypothetical protein [Arthrobacter sp. Bi26]